MVCFNVNNMAVRGGFSRTCQLSRFKAISSRTLQRNFSTEAAAAPNAGSGEEPTNIITSPKCEVLKIGSDKTKIGTLANIILQRTAFKRPTVLAAAGESSIYNALRAVIVANNKSAARPELVTTEFTKAELQRLKDYFSAKEDGRGVFTVWRENPVEGKIKMGHMLVGKGGEATDVVRTDEEKFEILNKLIAETSDSGKAQLVFGMNLRERAKEEENVHMAFVPIRHKTDEFTSTRFEIVQVFEEPKMLDEATLRNTHFVMSCSKDREKLQAATKQLCTQWMGHVHNDWKIPVLQGFGMTQCSNNVKLASYARSEVLANQKKTPEFALYPRVFESSTFKHQESGEPMSGVMMQFLSL